MMKNIMTLAMFAVVLSACSDAKRKKKETTETKPAKALEYKNPLVVQFGDPYILHASNDTFYMYGTGHVNDGFVCYSSQDMVNWTFRNQVYKAGKDSWTEKNFWAPEVYERNGKFYMFFSADWKNNPNNELENFKIGVAVSDNPTGPFKNLVNRPIFNPDYPIIDANLYTDDDGTNYLYYSRCCYKHPVESELADWAKANKGYDVIEESWVYGVKLSDDFTEVIGEPVLLMRPPVSMENKQTEWESRSVTNGEINRRWIEGSAIFKRNGKYYMTYSANFYAGQYYAVGYATADNPLGPFVKADNNPILEKNIEKGGIVTGTGHNNFVYDKNGQPTCIVYHGRTKATGNERVVFIDKVKFNTKGEMIIDGPTTDVQLLD